MIEESGSTPGGIAETSPPSRPTGQGDIASRKKTSGDAWWRRSDLRYEADRLHLGATDLDALAAGLGTPAYVCLAPRVADNIRRIHAALDGAGLDHRVYYAIKANRSPALLSYLRTTGLCGADVCSPGEMLRAISCGFRQEDISFTGTSLSKSDIETIARFPDVNVNLDSLASLDRLGKACPGREVGIRINPDVGIGYQGNDMLLYSGPGATKFGIYRDRLNEAIEIARAHSLKIVRIHFHAGCGYLDRELEQLAEVLNAAQTFIDALPDLREVNMGGGLGVPHRSTDRSLDLDRWAGVIAKAFKGRNLRVAVEPGDFIVKDAGALLATVTYVEQRKDVVFVGVDAGFNLAMEPAFYGLPCEPVPLVRRNRGVGCYTIVGNVNEALDKWVEDHTMPALQEGDRLALINAGGYAASMRSDHCLRSDVQEVLLID
ncbi:Diaminopimelate decarboxylase [Hartmannibacter diazotrophicus]|uniref:Diaminopimelate decarboxylase n=1 Tax=Hartmannibacter diazotrophicus TaxID=1482074 RepID=A0A2C9D3R4_9HYPH|nr:diaminopimelate decarboxylase [Hartmannibacter diazotrophicus]SON54967.1 Diaminopimelate decarboxylase [Hartmannibacter diazotrophicus]